MKHPAADSRSHTHKALSTHSIDRLTRHMMSLTTANVSMRHWLQCFDQTHQSLKMPHAPQPRSIRGAGCRDPVGEEIEDANASVAVMHGPFLREGVGMPDCRPGLNEPPRSTEGPLLTAPVAGRGRARSALDSHLPLHSDMCPFRSPGSWYLYACHRIFSSRFAFRTNLAQKASARLEIPIPCTAWGPGPGWLPVLHPWSCGDPLKLSPRKKNSKNVAPSHRLGKFRHS